MAALMARFTAQEAEAMQSAVRNVVERTISSLQSIGMSHHDALALLMLQASLRMDASEVRRVLKVIEDGLH